MQKKKSIIKNKNSYVVNSELFISNWIEDNISPSPSPYRASKTFNTYLIKAQKMSNQKRSEYFAAVRRNITV